MNLPGGEFMMGHDGFRPDERPAHKVLLAPFRAAVSPVTNAEYARFMNATGAEPPRFFADPILNPVEQPVVGVSWHEAQAYCAWLSAARDGAVFRLPTEAFRLPTEAEREYAARGGRAGLEWPWGNVDPGEYAPLTFVAEASGPHVPREVCANDFGLLCMAENVHEWCSDVYARDFYASSPREAPAGPAAGTRRASRGGSWRHSIKFTRVSARSSLSPTYRYNDYGFRLYMDSRSGDG
jgi:formylglycine-generating enzyme required for sulfatase activity